jgi:plasmid stability protein
VPVNLSIKNVPDALAQRLRARAAANHRSLQRELMAIVESAGSTPDALRSDHESRYVSRTREHHPERRSRPIEDVVREWRKILPHPTGGPSSVDIIRAMRDERYGVSRDQRANERRS